MNAEDAPRQKRVLRKHGLSFTPEYRVWQTMRHRCTSSKSPAWKDYGGRGITICDRWLDDPVAFLSDVGKRPSPAHEIDRIKNDEGYSPGNCRWVLRSVNDRNRRNNRHITHRGVKKTLAGWAEDTGIAADTLTKRIEAGWPVERALTAVTRSKAKKGCKTSDIKHPCADCGKPVFGVRCHTCENKTRPLRKAA